MGGSSSHEFMVLADSGEDGIVECDRCSYAANLERAEGVSRAPVAFDKESAAVQEVATPGMRTVADVAGFFQSPPARLIKTLIYLADDKPVAVLVPGDREVNEIKLKRALGCQALALADDAMIQQVTGAPVGFAGPVGLTIPVVADGKVKGYQGAITGANKADAHLVHVDLERDARVRAFHDVVFAKGGDQCPRCDGTLQEKRGIEVGHVFKLGTKYSEALGASFLSAEGQQKPSIMGCYGIGVTRTLQAAVEQNYDDDGIIWPISIAPYSVEVVALNMQHAESVAIAQDIVSKLEAAGLDVLYDDRDERPGVKFKDADLVGIPVRVNVGERGLAKGQIEVKVRKTREMKLVPIEQAEQAVLDCVSELRAAINS